MAMGRGLRHGPAAAKGGRSPEGGGFQTPQNPPSCPAGIGGNARREMSGIGVLLGE